MSGIDAHFMLRRGDFMLEATFQTPASGVTALFGPSGCGKSTLLNCIAGLEPAARGTLRVNDELWQDSELRVFVPAHRRRVGYVFQDAGLLAHLSVRGNLEYGMRRALPGHLFPDGGVGRHRPAAWTPGPGTIRRRTQPRGNGLRTAEGSGHAADG